MSRNNFIRVLCGCSLLLITACGAEPQTQQPGPQAKQSAPERKPVPIAVNHVQVGEAASYYVTTSTLEAEAHAEVRSRATGVLNKLNVEEGASVEKGQILALLDDADQKLRLELAQIAYDRASADFDRRRKMRDSGVLAPEEFDMVENTFKEAAANLKVAELDLSYTRIAAPISGTVVRRLVDRGDYISQGETLFAVMDLSPLLVRLHIPANRMGTVSPGQSLTLKAESVPEPLTADVSLVSPIVDPDTGTVKVTAELHQYPARIRPGDFVEVRVVTDRRQNAMMVPSVAVFEEQGKDILYIVEEGKAQRRTVEVGFVESGATEILSGITSEDLIVVKGQRNLRDGMTVDILEGPGAAEQTGDTTSKEEQLEATL